MTGTTATEIDHQPRAHAPVLFRWPTSFEPHGIKENPDMTNVGHLLRASMDQCASCMEYWAGVVSQDEENRSAVIHFIGSTYTWATEKCGFTWEELTGEGIYRSASQKILIPMRDGRVREMVTVIKGMHPDEVWSVVADALSASTIMPPEGQPE